jgi:hypothetical protein
MTRVTGIGGIFFKSKDPVALRTWYQAHLGIDVQDWGGPTRRPGRRPSGSRGPRPGVNGGPRCGQGLGNVISQ